MTTPASELALAALAAAVCGMPELAATLDAEVEDTLRSGARPQEACMTSDPGTEHIPREPEGERYRALNGEHGPVVICKDDEPGVVMAMTGRQQDAEEIAAALNELALLRSEVERLREALVMQASCGRAIAADSAVPGANRQPYGEN